MQPGLDVLNHRGADLRAGGLGGGCGGTGTGPLGLSSLTGGLGGGCGGIGAGPQGLSSLSGGLGGGFGGTMPGPQGLFAVTALRRTSEMTGNSVRIDHTSILPSSILDSRSDALVLPRNFRSHA